MTRGIDYIDAETVVVYGCILGKYGYAALSLDVAGVHDPVLNLFVGAKYAALAKKLIDQGRLAVVNMRDDCYIAYFFVHSFLLRMDYCQSNILSPDFPNCNSFLKLYSFYAYFSEKQGLTQAYCGSPRSPTKPKAKPAVLFCENIYKTEAAGHGRICGCRGREWELR